MRQPFWQSRKSRSMMDCIQINQLQIKTIIGVYPWERHRPQNLLVDLILRVDLSQASQSDSLLETIDYDALCALVTQKVSQTSFQLIEKIAGFISETLFENYSTLQQISVSVTKPVAISNAQSVQVTLHRQRITALAAL